MINEELFNRSRYIENNTLLRDEPHFNSNHDVVVSQENGEIKVYRPSIAGDGYIDIIEIDEEDIRD